MSVGNSNNLKILKYNCTVDLIKSIKNVLQVIILSYYKSFPNASISLKSKVT